MIYIKNITLHILSLIIGLSLWSYFYVNNSERFEITAKVNLNLPRNIILINKNKDFYIRILVETNRRFRLNIDNQYNVTKNLSVKGKIFPKKIKVELTIDDLKLPNILKVIKIIDKNIEIYCDIIKETILPIKLKSIFYKGTEVKDYISAIEPDYVSIKIPSGLARITKSIYLEPIFLDKLPIKTLTRHFAIPEKYSKYSQGKEFFVKVSISINRTIEETITNIPIKIIQPIKTIFNKIESIKITPDTTEINAKYNSNISTYNLKKNVLCYVEIKKIYPYIFNIPVICTLKNPRLSSKIKITEILTNTVKVKIIKKKQKNR